MPAQDHEFVHLHVHTDHSLLDGCSRTDKLCRRAAELGMKALSITDHGVLYGLPVFFKEAQKHGIKPLLGCEIYLVYEDRLGSLNEERRRQKSYHMGLLARNFTGYKNLSKIVSKAHTEGFYRHPRTDLTTLAEHSEGLIGFSGCLAAVIPQYLLEGKFEEARAAAARFTDIFTKDCFIVEIMDHGIEEQRRIIPDLLKIATEFGLKVIASNDVHYVNENDWEAHDALLCIQTGSRVSDSKRMRYESRQFYLKSREEMERLFKEIPGSITNTSAVAEMCEVELPFNEDHYPVYERPAEIENGNDHANFDRCLDIYVEKKNEILIRDAREPIDLLEAERVKYKSNGLYLFELCKQGLKERYGTDYNACRAAWGQANEEDRRYCEQLEYELAIITGTGFVDYFLIVWDFIAWARRQGIPVGPGRGSGAGCLVAYVLKITDIDPFRFGLLFERMLSLERVSPPDFDVDFCMRRRDEVVDYVRDKYGRDRVANIITFGTFGAKMIIRDLARVNDLEFAEGNKLAKMVPDELNITLEDSIRKSVELSSEVKQNPMADTIVRQGRVLEGMIRNTGKHACGVIIANQNITNLIPVTLQEGDLTTQYPKDPSEELGLLKMDFLGLKTLTVISDAETNVRVTRDKPEFHVEEVPLDDKKTFELLNSGRTTAVFQLESGGMQRLCRQIRLSSFEEIIALIALYRPGPMQFIPQFIEGKKDPSSIEIPHPLLKTLLEETYGVPVYQEQVMQSAQIIAGYTAGGADILRRAMGKKIRKVMDAQKSVFIKGAKETNNIDPKTAESIFKLLEKFAEYGFNKSHSAAYAMLSYRTAYLKANYPVEFMAAVLTSEKGNADKTEYLLRECDAMNLSILSPDINESRVHFTPVVEDDQRSIRFGMASVKGVGEVGAAGIVDEREANGAYQGFSDFISRNSENGVQRRVIDALIKTGAFDSVGEERADLLKGLEGHLAEAERMRRDRETGQGNLFEMMGAGGSLASKCNDSPNLRRRVKAMPMAEKLSYEKDLLGFYVSGHPMDAYVGIDTAVDSFSHKADLEDFDDRTPFRFCGIVVNSAIKYTRKDNKPMAVFNLTTRHRTYSMVMFSESYSRNRLCLVDGKLVLVHGVISRRKGEMGLTVHEIHDLESSIAKIIRKVTFILRPGDQTEGFIKQIRKTTDNAHGDTRLGISFLVDDQIIETRTERPLSFSLTSTRFKKLRGHPAPVGVRIDAEALKPLDGKRKWPQR